KILNSWAMGKAVVSTSVGCEGLAAEAGENILIRDDPTDFANAILAVLDDDELRRRLGERARATVEQLYSWEVIGHDLIEHYLRVAHGRASGTRDGHPMREAASTPRPLISQPPRDSPPLLRTRRPV